MNKLSLLLLLLFFPVFSWGSLPSHSLLLATNELNTYDPFIDHGEFQDNVTEQETINFFQRGRSLTLSLFGGYEGLTGNLRQIYGDSLATSGVALGFFFDMNFAFQVSGTFPHSHYNTILNDSPAFFNVGIDFKYYINKQTLTKTAADFLSPYVIFGPFWFRIQNYNVPPQQAPAIPITPPTNSPSGVANPNPVTPVVPITSLELKNQEAFSAFGAKFGVGLEVPLIKQSFLSLEASYLYTNLDFENRDLSRLNIKPSQQSPYRSPLDKLVYPDAPEVKGYRFFGDLFQVLILVGINF